MTSRSWNSTLLLVLAACGSDSGATAGLLAPDEPGGRNLEQPSRLLLEVEDPPGDNTGPIDVIRMAMRWDQATGKYEITLLAREEAPFRGMVRINVNLFNVDEGSFFSDTMNDIQLGSPQTTLTLTGRDPALTGWDPGERVYTNSLGGTPNPPGTTMFRTAVSAFPMGWLSNEDYIALTDVTQPILVATAGN
jgi:hypothetical protein